MASQSSLGRTEVLWQMGSTVCPVPWLQEDPWQVLCLMGKNNEKHIVRRAAAPLLMGNSRPLKLPCISSVLFRNPSGH